MTESELLTKMARMIKDVINACDTFASVHIPRENAPVCILPKGMRYKLGECLDDLRDVESPESSLTHARAEAKACFEQIVLKHAIPGHTVGMGIIDGILKDLKEMGEKDEPK